MTLTPGTRVRRYVIGASIGSGGMGEVYVANDVELDRTVALKILPGDAADDPERIRRFVHEAKAAVSLNHPNVAHIYDVGEENGIRFMAMEYVEGETLRRRLSRKRLPIDEALDIAVQTTSALASAHQAGVVHRDIKPENVMLRPDGYVKVLDFGLAKLVGARAASSPSMETATGVVMGTMHYMSPEQLRGDAVDARSDVFSIGVLFYEMLSGVRPFEASSTSGVIASILTEVPAPIDHVPAEVRAIVDKALAKKREDRYASAQEMLDDLRHVRHESSDRPLRSGDLPTQILQSAPVRGSQRRVLLIAAIAVVAALAAGVTAWWITRARNVRHARESIARVEQLAEQQKYFEAWSLGKSIQSLVGADGRLTSAMQKVSMEITVETTPPGARVYLQRFTGDNAPPRELIGTTPITRLPMPKSDYILTIEKDGFAPSSRSISTLPLSTSGVIIEPDPPEIRTKLMEQSRVPPGMVAIPGGPYRLGGYNRPAEQSVKLSDYFMDAYEVSNADFEKFIAAGGYAHPEFWRSPVRHQGKTLSFAEAMALFHDTTGLPGPRSWAGGKYPPGHENYPVTDVSWYEAAAYAAWAGKELPNIFQWDKAARTGDVPPFGERFPWGVVTENTDVARRANFRGNGPMTVDSLPFGMSGFGVFNLAGNVSEWCRNPYRDGFAAAGGAFDDAIYEFGVTASYPGTYASGKLGFRCVKEMAPVANDPASAPLQSEVSVPVYTPASNADYAKYAAQYEYEKTPLEAKVIEKTESEAWTREKISYRGAGGATALAYLYLPKGARRPLQVIHFVPASDVMNGTRQLTEEMENFLAPHIRGGRAAFGVVLEGFLGRPHPPKWTYPEPPTAEYKEFTIANITDIRRGLDVLATRPEIDMSRLAYFAPSAGSSIGVILTAVETRYRAVFFIGAGLKKSALAFNPAANRINFAPHIHAPILMMAGRYDEIHQLETEATALFRLLPEPKKLVVYDGGHIAPQNILVPQVKGWLDDVMGAVQ